MSLEDTSSRIWQNVPEPAQGHPEELLLWKAEEALQTLVELSESPDVKNAFVKRLEVLRSELKDAVHQVLGTEHTIAFVGDIGVGKSTSICRVSGLEILNEETGVLSPVLEVGGGGVTVCEVHLVQGTRYGLVVHPKNHSEIRTEVREFAILLKDSPEQLQDDDSSDTPSGTSKEIARAIRNMSGLVTRRVSKRGPDGEILKRSSGRIIQEIEDRARELAQECVDTNEFAEKIINRIKLEKRTRRELWYSESSEKEPLKWLQEVFNQVNNGRHPEFSIPERIDVVIPHPIIGSEPLEVRLVDTKGIDRTSEREDIEHHFSEPNTILVLCSMFNSTPSTSTQHILERAIDGGFSNLQAKFAILALPRPEEALAVKDDLGFSPVDVDEGYELKREQAEMRLKSLGVPEVNIEFFNSREDNPERLKIFLMDLVHSLRETHCKYLEEVVDGVNALVNNIEAEQTWEIQRQVARRLRIWVTDNLKFVSNFLGLDDSLMRAINNAHPSSLNASVRRQGEWYNLDFSLQLGYGSRRVAVVALEPRLESFNAIAGNLEHDADLKDALDLVQQSRRFLSREVESIYGESQLLGMKVYRERLKPDTRLWEESTNEWGRGSGYRDRVYRHYKTWFDSRTVNQERLQTLIEDEWLGALHQLSEILDAYEV